MPLILPVDDAVSWPVDEGVIGVVGVAPWATIDFLRALYLQVAAEKDWHYPRVLCDINTKLPSRGRHLQLGERDPSPFIAETIVELAHQGASLVVVPCNTAHILYPAWAADAPVAVPSIVQASVVAVAGASGQVAVFASRSVYQHGLYERALSAAGLSMAVLSTQQIALVDALIAAVKVAGHVPLELLPQVESLLAGLAERGVGALILGCTELAELAPLGRRHLSCVVDSNAALARAALLGIGMRPSSGDA
ncbi:aspartate/glutamate racemase family protein [Pseudomonas sp. GLN_6]|uniref:aspartate/glutamate racemase family protein n=1 Tax=unclassified Pseudomonas TaxID=196821 RepID=UPI0021501DD0|nr:aspartate/glutamate racemase family protein [Pseudomonas sp. 32.2.56]MCR4509702.1 aspartate/glutamate racemase family protein [Pseudomonas sp. 32.2.56]